MPSGASSAAIDLETRFTAPLEALYQVSPGRGRIPAVEPILMITPDFCLRMSGTTACANRKIDLTLTAMSRSNSASSTSSMGRRTWLMPALLTRMSIAPNASTVALTAASTSARRETSQRTAIALLLIDAAAARAASPSMSMTATRAGAGIRRPSLAPVGRQAASRSHLLIDPRLRQPGRNRRAPKLSHTRIWNRCEAAPFPACPRCTFHPTITCRAPIAPRCA